MTVHAGERLRQRYGLRGDYNQIQRIRRYIEQGGGVCTSKSRHGSVTMLVNVDGEDMRVVYDPVSSNVLTAVPLSRKHHRRLRRGPRKKT